MSKSLNMAQPALLQVEDVCFSYQEGLEILHRVNLEIYANEFIGIIGPNGGGKTTLLKLIMGFLKPTHGSIFILGKRPSESIHQFSYVPQNLRYDKEFPISVLELVLSGRLSQLPWYGFYKRKDKQAAFAALDQVGLSDFGSRSFGSLSGGQAQRVLIARALASEPKILLLDEPTANVDSQAEADIYSLLNQLRKEMTILMVTHDLKTAIHQVDRVLVVQKEVDTFSTQEVCEHFAMGLYHPRLKNGGLST
jgi:zinc transport system ATP-binding protein